MKILYNGTIVVDESKQYEKGYLVIDNDKIVAVGSDADFLMQLDKNDHEWIDLKGNYVLPGFIDIHIHGAMGKDLIEGSQEAIDAVANNVIQDGCTSFMASLTVVSHQEMLTILDGFANVKQTEKGANFIGVHEEGPYLSKEYKALMDERYLRDPSIEELDEMIAHSHQKIKIMTVAPERKGMDQFIAYATQQGIAVMIGHTNASAEDVHVAVVNGAKGFTHLYNAMSQHLHRTPGCVTGAMIETDTYVELICDGFHVHKDVVLATYKQFGANRIIMITDAMLGKDMPDGEYTFSHLNCYKEGKFVRVKQTGRIAGSAYGMIDMVKSMLEICHCSLNEIVQMASVNPSKIAQVEKYKGTLAVGKDADLCILNKNMKVIETYVLGEIVYKNNK